jgi:hypothetical protein
MRHKLMLVSPGRLLGGDASKDRDHIPLALISFIHQKYPIEKPTYRQQ